MALDNQAAAQKANFTNYAYTMFDTGLLQPEPADLTNAGYDLLFWLNAKDFSTKTFYGYIAVSKSDPGEYVLAIRGTRTFQEWLLDFAAVAVPFRGAPNGGFVALGFHLIFESFEFIEKATGAVMSLTGAAGKLANVKSLLVTGHSLGAALATLTGAYLALNNTAGLKDKLEVTTFASPRVGLLDFALAFNHNVKNSHRIWNVLDIVPEFPTFPFIHVNGFGDKLNQGEAQLSRLRITPPCEHHLRNHQWLLDPANYAIAGVGCDLSAAGLEGVTVGVADGGIEAMSESLANNGGA